MSPKLRPQGHPVLDKLTWFVKEPSRLLPNLPSPVKTMVEPVMTYHADGTKSEWHDSERRVYGFYDWLDNVVMHRVSARAKQYPPLHLALRPLQRVTCFLWDTSLGVYDEISEERWVKGKANAERLRAKTQGWVTVGPIETDVPDSPDK